MLKTVPRLVLAGTNSGCGKTTLACALLQAFVKRGMKVAAFKCGPDYIDPMFHSRIIGAKSANLDLFFFDENTTRYLLAKNSSGMDISIIEGVMGFYDGMGLTTTKASTYELAQITQSPVILVISAKGASLSVLAAIHGFMNLYSDNRICGVILNQCSARIYRALVSAIQERFSGQLRPLGFLPPMPACTLESRHLGLITAAEIEDLRKKVELLAKQAEQTVDLDTLLALAGSAAPLVCKEVKLPQYRERVRIAIARDKAFCFYYQDSLEALMEMGAELILFSPMEDKKLPNRIHGLYLGGGYPELYAKQLSENKSMLRSVRTALEQEIPCIAECGGFMYLTGSIGEYTMTGVLPGTCYDTGKLTRFGYVTLRAERDCLLGKAGQEIPGHEFHHWDCEHTGDSFTATKPSGKSWPCAIANEHLYAGYPHFHFYANPGLAARFYKACLKEKHRYD